MAFPTRRSWLQLGLRKQPSKNLSWMICFHTSDQYVDNTVVWMCDLGYPSKLGSIWIPCRSSTGLSKLCKQMLPSLNQKGRVFTCPSDFSTQLSIVYLKAVLGSLEGLKCDSKSCNTVRHARERMWLLTIWLYEPGPRPKPQCAPLGEMSTCSTCRSMKSTSRSTRNGGGAKPSKPKATAKSNPRKSRSKAKAAPKVAA